MDILREVIYEQNKELLERIANDKYNDECDKEEFMNKIMDKAKEKAHPELLVKKICESKK